MTVALKLSNWGVSKMMMNRGKWKRLQKGDVVARGTKLLLEAGGFDALFEVDVEARRDGESLEVNVEVGGIEGAIV